MSILDIIIKQHSRIMVSEINTKKIRQVFDKLVNNDKKYRIYYCFEGLSGENKSRTSASFGVDDSRELGLIVKTIFPGEQENIIILAYAKYSDEAQSALLKLLEETLSNIHICLIYSKGTSLLSTIISRTVAISLSSLNSGQSTFDHLRQKFTTKQLIRLQKILAKSSKLPSSWIEDFSKIMK